MRKTIGLALGGGGVRGLAHVGVIKTFLKHNIPIDYIAGCSIGAWVGAHYALRKNINSLESYTVNKKKEKLLSFWDLSFSGGIIKGEKVRALLDDWLGQDEFKDLKIPFQAVATDLVTGLPVVLNDGRLSQAVYASMAIPWVFKPVVMKKQILVDGAVCNPVPDDLVKAMGADIVVAVNLDNFQQSGLFKMKDLSFASTGLRSFDITRHYLAKYSMKSSDIIISPPLARYDSWKDYFMKDVGKKIMKIGEVEAEKIIPQLKEMMGE
ncbi:MAG: patatin-like phospholipase family protein [Candidatus Magasanikbacteria bacterium]|jgi:NTE family protein